MRFTARRMNYQKLLLKMLFCFCRLCPRGPMRQRLSGTSRCTTSACTAPTSMDLHRVGAASGNCKTSWLKSGRDDVLVLSRFSSVRAGFGSRIGLYYMCKQAVPIHYSAHVVAASSRKKFSTTREENKPSCYIKKSSKRDSGVYATGCFRIQSTGGCLP